MAVVRGDLTGLVQRFNACLNSCSGGQNWLVLCNFPIRYVCSPLIFCLPSTCHVIILLIRIWLLGIPTTHCPFRIMHDTIIIFCIIIIIIIIIGHTESAALCCLQDGVHIIVASLQRFQTFHGEQGTLQGSYPKLRIQQKPN